MNLNNNKSIEKITIFNTAIASANMGDFIIMDAVNKHLMELFPDAMFFHSLTHDKVSYWTYKFNKISKYSFVGGTNLLTSDMNKNNQWRLSLYDTFYLKNITLMGVGWQKYQSKTNFYTKYILKSILNKDILHSVRDSYTQKLLEDAGVKNVINTGCPTMWNLTKEHCKKVPTAKAKNVIFTLTSGDPDLKRDKEFIDIILKNYERVFFWPQGNGDDIYLHECTDSDKIEIIGANLESYDRLLKNSDINIDYIGSRLHGGIRSLQNLKRAIIIGIDNRAEEKAKDFNIKVLSREQLELLEEMIISDFKTEITINEKNIAIWKNQFK